MKKIKKIFDFFYNLIYPIKCFDCKKNHYYFCPDCLKIIPNYLNNRCLFCGVQSLESGDLCIKCKKLYHLNNIQIFTYYDQEIIKKLIYEMKYNSVFLIARDIGIILAKKFKSLFYKKNCLLVPVPMHKAKIKKRGFNQTYLIAQSISRYHKIPICNDLIIKTKNTLPQMSQRNFLKRQDNLKNAFSLNKEKIQDSKNKKIILIDDVFTTGTTIKSCAEILNNYGFKNLNALIFARKSKKY
ncbi:MAG: hypothetical protein GF335_01470 [Candidatus Moranbacteria bacterium]|nr:hypothetical protein [Candidatus Moranbacteria bacterium]